MLINDESKNARQAAITRLREIADALENGAEVISGGIMFHITEENLNLDSDIVVRKVVADGLGGGL